jgi:hypothetical protein
MGDERWEVGGVAGVASVAGVEGMAGVVCSIPIK